MIVLVFIDTANIFQTSGVSDPINRVYIAAHNNNIYDVEHAMIAPR